MTYKSEKKGSASMNAELVMQELEALSKERTKKMLCRMERMSHFLAWQLVP